MKKNYEKTVLTTELFVVEDVITASLPAATDGLGGRNANREIDWGTNNIPSDVLFL